MRIKRFEARDTKTALAMVKKEMGEDAVILANKTLSRGKGGKRRVEVLAAMDYDLEALTSIPPQHDDTSQQSANKTDGYDYSAVRRPKTPENKPIPLSSPRARHSLPEADPLRSASKNGSENISFEAHDFRMRFSSLLSRQGQPKPYNPAATKKKSPAPKPGRSKAATPKPEDVARWRSQVVDQIQLKPLTISPGNHTPTVLALVGATGVGKTTTAAKLAAWFSLREQCKVTLVSMDCYRIGATDQLRTYAKIMRMPCEIVLRKKDLKNALARHNDKDLIIIDTAGKSPYDRQHITELQEWFSVHEGIEPYLTLSATTKKEDLATIIKTYAPLASSALVLTKLDETRAYAALCQQVAASCLPVSSLCIGQRVPEDFLMASKDILHTLFKKGWAAVAPEVGAMAV